MRRELNPELDRIILDSLAEKYKLLEPREGIHLSSLNYCLTKAYLDLKAFIEPTDTELLLFATGYGLQEVMTHSSTATPLYVKDEVTYRPDGVIPISITGIERLVEMKSTRAGVKRYQEGGLPDTWITYMMGGACIRGKDSYDLAVIYLAERPTAKIISETIYFEQEELEENWRWIISRRDLYKNALATETVPTPFTTVAKWACENCRYRMLCDSIVMMSSKQGSTSHSPTGEGLGAIRQGVAVDFERAEKDIKELW